MHQEEYCITQASNHPKEISNCNALSETEEDLNGGIRQDEQEERWRHW
jgi:hypothetical protein